MNARSISLVALVSLTACGRIGYDARDAATTPTMDGGADARADLDGQMQDGRMPMPDADPMPCMGGRSRCGERCVDLRTDNASCGSCSNMCPSGAQCVDSACVPRTNAPAGTECTESAECGSTSFGPSLCLTSVQGWPTGHCTNFCRTPSDCLSTEACVDVPSARVARPPEAQGMCFVRCDTPGQIGSCRSGYTCTMQRDGFAVCTPTCVAYAGTCGANRCDPVTGQCLPCATLADCRENSATCDAPGCRCTAATDCGLWGSCNARSGRCGCANDFFCNAERRCDLGSGLCVPR